MPDIDYNWAALSGLLPPHVEDRLAAIIIRDDDHDHDNLCWGYSNNDFFSVNSAYKLSTGDIFLNEDKGWKIVWKLRVPNCIQAFIWLLKHQKIMCKVEQIKRGFTSCD